jgi:hypothetical protein
MDKIYTIIDKETGQELYAKFDDEVTDNEVAIEELRTEYMENPYFDFETRTFYDKPIIE